MNPLILIFYFIVFIFSAIIHEVSHGAAALKFGDTTAKDQGRLTLNPIKHIDPVGSVVLPLMLLVLNSPVIFGWAKPVPFNPFNLKNPKKESGLIALAGPASNLVIAIIFGIILKLAALFSGYLNPSIFIFLNIIILVNIILAIFNLTPIPPLDGSKVLFSLLPKKFSSFEMWLEKYGFIILIAFIFLGFDYIVVPFVLFIFHLFGGTLI